MQIETTFDDVRENYHSALTEVLSRRARGNSRAKTIAPSMLEWSYRWSEFVECVSPSDLVQGKGQRKQETVEEEFARRCRNSTAWVVAKGGRTVWSSANLPTLPEPVKAGIRRLCEERVKEETRYTAMTPAQRDGELRDALKYLMGTKNKGFVVLSIPSKDGK